MATKTGESQVSGDILETTVIVLVRAESGLTDIHFSRCVSIMLIKALVYSFSLIFLFYLFSREVH